MAGQLQVVDKAVTGDIAAAVLAWYDRHRRDLPWRAKAGEAADPYPVWLSEIMLQQTTVTAVAGYYQRFIERWPCVHDLAAADLDEVLREWAGLGYYARARKLHQCAKAVVRDHGGRFPADPESLMALPGIGPYTAGALAAIAFGHPAAAVDGNVERVIARLHGIETPLPAAKKEIRSLAESLVPQARPGDFAQAMMDLGATICTPRRPGCPACPLSQVCIARRLGIAETLPRRAEKKPRPVRHGTAFVVRRDDGAVLLRRRSDSGLLGGMMEVPSSPWRETPAENADDAPVEAAWRLLPSVMEHTFTHFHLVLRVMAATVPAGTAAPDSMRFVAADDVAGEALPSLMRKVIAAVLGADAVRRRPSRRAPAGAGDRSA